MARKKDALNRLLKLLNKKSMSPGDISTTLKIDRKTEYRITQEALNRRWIEKDSSGKYHLTLLGKINVGTTESPMDSLSLEAQTQIIDDLNLRPNRPTAKCTIEIENADKIKELDSQTKAEKRFLTSEGLWLPENDTNLKASMAAVVDSILDLKAKKIGLRSMLNEELRNTPTPFDMRDYFPGHDALRRYENLAKTKFNILIEFDGEKWASKQDFVDLEKKMEKRRESYSENIRLRDERAGFNKTIYKLSAGGALSTNNLQANHLFRTRKELKKYLINHFKINQVIGKDRLNTILKNGFAKKFFSEKKMTLYHLKVNRDKEFQFLKSLPFLNYASLSERQQDKTRGRVNQRSTIINTDNIISTISEELEYFEKAYPLLLAKVIEKFDRAYSNYHHATTKNAKENFTAHLLQTTELLDIFPEIMIAYVIRSMILWPNKIENRNILNKTYSILFSKIADIRILIAQKLDSYLNKRSNDGAMSKMYMTRNLLKLNDIFKDSNMEKESEELMDSIWNIYKECIQDAFPEPLIYGWEFDYKNDGWKRLVQLQMQHPKQTYDNFLSKTADGK